MPGIDSFTKLMLHCNGSDASTSFPDASFSSHSVTANDNAQVDTAQSVFGGASGLVDGSGDYLSALDSTDWDFGTSDLAIDCRVRFNSLGGNQAICGRATDANSYFYWALESGAVRFRDYNSGNIIDITFGTPSLSINTWYHFAITRDGNNFRFFIDGVQFGSTTVDSSSFLDRSVAFNVGSLTLFGYDFDGWIDEFRVSVGDSRWTSNFTPPTEEYSSTLLIDINESISLSDSVIISTDPEQINVDETIILSDNIDVLTNPEQISVNETIVLSDLVETAITHPGHFASKVIHVNPLYFVTNTDPARIIEVDISTPTAPVHTSYELTGAKNAKSVSFNDQTNKLYVACADGIVVEVDQTDLTIQSIIDLSDTDDLETISTLSSFGLTYTGTENIVGELYLLDDRSEFIIDADFQLLKQRKFRMDSNFDSIEAFKIDSDFQLLAESQFTMDSDFQLLTAPVESITPLGMADVHVFINAVELETQDLVLGSTIIEKTVSERTTSTFKLARKHDDLNKTYNGTSSIITNQNAVIIKIGTKTVFTGNVGEINPNYGVKVDEVSIIAYGDVVTSQANCINLPLAGLDDKLNLYHILVQNFKINNPPIDPDEENPKKYKGIKVNLGTEITQHVNRRYVNDTITNYYDFSRERWESTIGKYAEQIEKGEFRSFPSATYFWSPTVHKFISETLVKESEEEEETPEADVPEIEDPSDPWEPRYERTDLPVFKIGEMKSPFDFSGDIPVVGLGSTIAMHFMYIGTSLSPVSSDLWRLSAGSHRVQFVKDDTEEELGDYTVGVAPFREISVKNGKFNPAWKWSDENDGLYSLKDERYDYIAFAKKVADLEYQKLLNINGAILPDTNAVITTSIDALLYYNLGILTRININNTTQPNIFKNNNGFPVSIKSFTINTGDMTVSIQADNSKSAEELEKIDGQFPDDQDAEYVESFKAIKIAPKSDMKTQTEVDQKARERVVKGLREGTITP